MNLETGFRFYSHDDVLADRVRWALEKIFRISRLGVDAILMDPGRRVLMRVAEDGTLGGFVVFKDYKSVLLSPDNAFIASQDKQLLGAPGLKVYSFEQIWFRGKDFDMHRIVAEVIPAMSRVLSTESTRHALVSLLSLHDSAKPLREELLAIGFHANPNVYDDYCFDLRQIPTVSDAAATVPEDIELHDFNMPPDADALAHTFNRIFADGDQVLDADAIHRMIAQATFAKELSMWVAQDHRVAGFIWMFWQKSNCVRLNLIGTDPDFRGQGLVLRCTPTFMQICQKLGVTELTFTIQGENQAPRKIAKALGALPYQQRQTFIRAI